MEELELELKALRFQTLVQSDSNATTEQKSTPTHAKSQLTRHLLKDAIQSQQFALAGLQAMLSKYAVSPDVLASHR